MKNFAILLFLFIFSLAALGQPPNPKTKRTPKPVKTVAVKLGSEAEELEKASAVTNPAERLAALQNFTKNFPESTEAARVQGLIVAARAELGVIKLQAKETAAGIELYKAAVQDAPTPVPDEIFTKVLLGLPVSLYTLNERAAAFDVAKLIEEKVGANGAQLLDLSGFYLNVEYGTEAIRLAQRAVELTPDSANAYKVLAAANRLNFRLEDAASAYAKAVELDGESIGSKLSLAEMKRALGKADEAAALYREILTKEPENKAAQAGLALAVFDTGKRADAEKELKKALAADPQNSKLLTSAAYWYAARGFNDEAVEYAQKAIAIEPRNVWSYIAQARALTAQNKPLEAEKILLAARQYSDFPTLDYELAAARLAAGLYREAAETLKRSFTVNKDGAVEAYLGNRILADAGSFTDLLSLERRVALFETKAADSEQTTNQLKSLLRFNQKLEAADATEEELAQAAEEFAQGGDNMRLHRQLFAASRLLKKKAALPKVLELTQAAVGGVDAALNVASPSASVLADEIYDSRQYAISQNLIIVVPEIPRPTLSAILRGQIEDIAGRALLEQKNVPQSVVRLKRAMSVLPDKSAWQRASAWHLGEALQAEGSEKEALEAFIKGYNKDFPDPEKRAFIENLYVKVNGSADGLDDRIGAKPDATVATTENRQTPVNTDNVRPTQPAPSTFFRRDPARVPKADVTPQTPVITPEPTPAAKVEPTPAAKVEPTPANETVVATPTGVTPVKTDETALPESVPVETPAKTPEVAPSPETVETEKAPVKPEPSPVTVETPKSEEVKNSETKTEEAKPDEVKTEVKPDEVKPDEVKADEVKTDELKTDEVKADEVKAEPSPTPAETQATPIPPTTESKPEETRSDETKSPSVTPEESKPEESKPTEEKPAEEKPKIKSAEKPAEKPAETTPKPQNVSVVITDTLAQIPSSTTVSESKTNNKKVAPKTSPTAEKSLFEPVVISVGKTGNAQSEKTEPVPPAEKPTEILTEEKPREQKQPEETLTTEKAVEEKPAAEKPVAEIAPPQRSKLKKPAVEVVITDNLNPETKSAEKPAENKPADKPTDEKYLTGENRPRIIITENTGSKTVTEEIASCKLVVAPGSLSLLNGGGSLGVNVAFDGDGDYRQIRAASSSPEDIEVRADAEVGASQNRAFFIVKSVSAKTGVYTLTFEAPCGRKEILVRVR